jgi:hypothetical protein
LTLRRLIIIAMLVGALGILLVYEHSRITRSGYEISRLSRDEAKMVEGIRIVNVDVMKRRQPEEIREQVAKLQLQLRPAHSDEVMTASLSRSGSGE